MKIKKIKQTIFLILLIVLIFVLAIFFMKKKLCPDGDKIINTHTLNNNLVYNVKIDNIICPYDKSADLYYYSSSNFSENLSFDSYYDVDFVTYNVHDNIYEFLVYDNNYYTIIKVLFDMLPIINIYDMDFVSDKIVLGSINNLSIDEEDIDEDSSHVGIQIINLLQNNGSNYFVSLGDLSFRGASSAFFEKKSYKLKLEHEFGFLGAKEDTVWVLDALCADSSKIRNKLSSDLWNLINDNQFINNDLSGDFVELFVNNEYRGLYVLKEKVDKSVTKVGTDGMLLKAAGHLDTTMINNLLDDKYSIYDSKIMNFEVKKFNEDTISVFLSKIRNYYDSNRSYDSIVDSFDLNNYINYKIFVSLLTGEDNVTSNQYYSMVNKDSKLLITPWDMDLTWGSFWNIYRPTLSEFIWDKDFDYNWLDGSIFGTKDEDVFNLLKARYWELRKDVITMDTINGYLDSYEELLVNSGAAERDAEKWYKYDIKFEIERIREWAKLRIDFLDQYFS